MRYMRDNVMGCIVGGAVGDFLGAPYEGTTGPLQSEIPKSSHITDDTQLTLATCESIIDSAGVDPKRISRSFLYWFSERRITGIGSSTLKALRDLLSERIGPLPEQPEKNLPVMAQRCVSRL